MVAYLLRRAFYIPAVLLVVTFLAFAAIQLQPGDCLADLERVDPEAAQRLREELGLDRPVWVQYARWLGSFRRGLGVSCTRRISAVTYLFQGGAWARSLSLAGAALLLSLGLGVPLGLLAALRQGGLSDYLIRSASAFSLALPHFLIALSLVLLLFWLGFGSSQWGLLPPLAVVVLAQWATLARHMRAYLLDVLNQPYIQVARSKGLSERLVNCKHALRNALHPLLGLMGFWLPSLFESTIAVSIVMRYPTVELNLWDAIVTQDQYVVASGLFILGGVLMVSNLLADVALAWADPRIRYD